MRHVVREALRYLWTSLWRQHEPVAAEMEHDVEGVRRRGPQARFWTEYREGQREAQARKLRPR